MGQRTNSPIDDPMPVDLPQFEQLEDEPAEETTESFDRKGLLEYIDARLSYFESYLPGGEAVLNLTQEEKASHWEAAATIRTEFKALADQIKNSKRR
jgi:hypothetical protein